MPHGVVKPAFRELALVTCAVPDLREEGVPVWAGCLVEDLSGAARAVAELREVVTFPWDRVQLVFLGIQVVWGPLLCPRKFCETEQQYKT